MSPHEKLLLVVGGPAVLAVVIGWLFHWYVLDARSWFGWLHRERRGDLVLEWPDWREPVTDEDAAQLVATWHEDLPGPDMPARAGEYHPADREIRVGPSGSWRSPDTSQLDGRDVEASSGHLEPWLERAWWNDPDLTVWDARLQADRCWEILHVKFPRLRAELGCPA